jgi:hypothetical protein
MGEAPRLVSPARVFARPTADQIWLGPSQQAALSQLSRPAQVRLILGPSSCGKSTLAAHLAHQMGPDPVVLKCRGPKNDSAAVLASLLQSAGLAPWDLSEVDQRNLLTVFVQQRRSQGRRILLLVDDAQDIKPAAMEELERLLALRIDSRPALEWIVVGPPSVSQQWVRSPAAPDLIVHELGTAAVEDLAHYLDWRLRRFEIETLLTHVAAQMIARLSGGRYAAADVLCQVSLLVLRQLRLERVDARVVRQAVSTLAARQGAKLEVERDAAEQPPNAPPQASLLISREGKVLSKVTLGQRTLVGRSEHNDVCLPNPYLSRHHAAIVGTPEGYYLVDLNSANGVALNGRNVERAVLCDQDVLTMGPFRLKIQILESLTRGSPLPEPSSLAETAVMPQQAHDSAVWRVK